jgi:SAM-dependent methyltransferase
MSWRQSVMDRYYNRAHGWVDGTTEFHTMCRGGIPAGASILEIGAGPANRTSEMLATLGPVTGLDVDPDVKSNRFLQRAETYDGSRFPFADSTFDACVSDYVMEHIPNVREHFGEAYRVLKPGGAWMLRTPNRFHYVAMVSWLTPQWFHRLVANRLRANPEDAHDPYPTVYAANSRSAITQLAASNGFVIEELRMIEKEPSYGMASRLLFYPFLAYERAVNATEALAPLRANILAILRKP